MASLLTLLVLLTQAPPSFAALIAEAEKRNLARESAINDEEAARLALEWLRALKEVVDSSISDPNLSSRTHPWFSKQTGTVFYNDLGGNWLIDAEVAWKLHADYKETAAADDLAWLAATLPKGGECEGYAPCYMAIANVQSGEYLRLHPRGRHTGEAMGAIIDAIERVEQMLDEYPTLFETSHCDDLMNELAALEDAVQQADAAEQARTSEKIHELASRCEP